MAQVNNNGLRECLQEILKVGNISDINDLIKIYLEAVMGAQMEAHLQATKNERNEERQGYRNGNYERTLITKYGKLNLRVPRDRDGNFSTNIFEKYQRCEQALILTMQEMVIKGISTRSVGAITEKLCGTSFSKSTISEFCKKLDPAITEFRNAPITCKAPIVHIDAMYIRVREEHKIVKKALMMAMTYNDEGYKEILGYAIKNGENEYTWTEFLRYLENKGLSCPELIVSDAHKAIQKAIEKVYPASEWQRCQAHFARNVLTHTNSKTKKVLGNDLHYFFSQSDKQRANEIANQILSNDSYSMQAMRTFEEGYIDTLVYTSFPENIHSKIKTNNIIERLNREIRRREKVICIFPSVESAERLIGAILMDMNDENSVHCRSTQMKDYINQE